VDWLGDSLEQIGREKAGIFRRGHPAVLGSADMPRSVWTAIEQLGARPVAAGRDFHASTHGERWDFESDSLTLRELPLPALPGEHQVGNAATALAAIASGEFGVPLTHSIVSQALRSVRVAGRFQIVTGEVEWVLDVAHNVPAAQVLSANLRRLPRANRTFAICGILGDKDIRGITAVLAADIDAWILAGLAGPRAVGTRELAQRLPAGASVLEQAADVASACRAARAAARPGDRVLVFGSFLTVGPALEFLGI
jgi:dihydrofolate synthase/folylpolyglutamate synthase